MKRSIAKERTVSLNVMYRIVLSEANRNQIQFQFFLRKSYIPHV